MGERSKTEGAGVVSGRSPGVSLKSLHTSIAFGAAFYALAAGFDAFMTIHGLKGDPALAVAKLTAGLVLWIVAARMGRAIHEEVDWIEPALPAPGYA